jgi:SAM-dependent methyltransferase
MAARMLSSGRGRILMATDVYTQANHAHWDEVVAIHAASEFYDVPSFLAGENKLKSIELAEVGDVAGRSLLHLQCHFGLDTLSWARLGARVTGLDFSEQAIATAQDLARQSSVNDARFVCSNIYDAPKVLPGEHFDVVFTSYGALTWLADLPRWAQIAASFVRPGGIFYISEFHPIAFTFDDAPDVRELRGGQYPYFPAREPQRYEGLGTYTDRGESLQNDVTYEYPFTVGAVVTALADAGLQIEFLHEVPVSSFKMLPFLELDEEGWWRLPPSIAEIPLQFSIRARKPA